MNTDLTYPEAVGWLFVLIIITLTCIAIGLLVHEIHYDPTLGWLMLVVFAAMLIGAVLFTWLT